MHQRNHVLLISTAIALLTALFAAGQLPTAGQAAEPEPTAAIHRPEVSSRPLPLPEPTQETRPGPDWSCVSDADGEHIFLYDCTGDTMLYCTGSPRDSLYPASITKLFTAYVALQYLKPTQTVTAAGLSHKACPACQLAEGRKMLVGERGIDSLRHWNLQRKRAAA